MVEQSALQASEEQTPETSATKLLTASAENGRAHHQASPEQRQEADRLKEVANAAFKDKQYAKAIATYTKAIEADPGSAILYANRAAAHIRLENYGSGIADSSRAIELDADYIKGYFRRADANFACGKASEALADFRRAAKHCPRDADLRKKLAACEKEVKRMRFQLALASPDEPKVPVAQSLDLGSMRVEEGYAGPRMQGSHEEGYTVSEAFVDGMVACFRERRLVHSRFAFEVVMAARARLKTLPTLVDVEIPDTNDLTVCGDVHGQYYDLLNIFKLNGKPSPSNPYLFNGDFVDRGSFSVEVILTLFAYSVLYPGCVHLARGNHESQNMNAMYGFDGEVKAKYSSTLVDLFRETFCHLPLAHVLNGRIFVVHGGLFARDGVTLDELRRLDRVKEPPEEGLMCECLWSDPQPMPGRAPSKRGIGVAFGPDVTRRFLADNKLDLVIRSHEVKEQGYEVEHGGNCVTIFSAPNYVDAMGNLAAFARIGRDLTPRFTTFSAVPHPPVRPMQYANPFLSGFMQG